MASEETGKAKDESLGTSILDLSMDGLVECAASLNLRDLASMAMTCKHMREAVYIDSIWEHQCRKRWPPKQVSWGTFQYCGGRKAYQERHLASQKFQFLDPADWHITSSRARTNHILVDDDFMTVAQGSRITTYNIKSQAAMYSVSSHNARVTCMRLVPSTGLVSWSNGDGADTLLVTSSMDHTIRLWRKGRSLRTFRGHSGSVTTLSNSLSGSQYGLPTLASGGTDGTIRLWALASGQKRGHSPLQKTFRGHEHAIKQLVVAEYNPSLLVSAANDSKVRVWDVASSITGTGALVGSTRGPDAPVGLMCKGSTCFVAGGSSFMLVDLRLMRTIVTVAAHEFGILNFSTPVSGEMVCTGGVEGTAKLWDLRNTGEPYATLGNHVGEVNFVYMDHYKAVTGGSKDGKVYIWDAKTGDQLSTLDNLLDGGLTAMAVSGTRIATATCNGDIQFRDFSNCAVPMMQTSLDADLDQLSKFWDTSFHEDN